MITFSDADREYPTNQEIEFIDWWNELDEDDKHMLHSLAIYMALGGKLNMFNVQERNDSI